MLEIKKLTKFTEELALKTGEMLLKEAKKSFKVDFKGLNNLVTELDVRSEKEIKAAIEKEFPDHAILAEEGGSNLQESDYLWIIDPIDGTTNFAHQHPFFAISIGLQYKNELIAGVVFAPKLNELFSASKGGGAFLNKQKIRVSEVGKIGSALAATGFPYEQEERQLSLNYMKKMLNKVQGIRRCGSASLDLCYIAAGRCDFFWELGLKAWDVAAGSLIVAEAGGIVTSLDGSKLDLYSKNFLASNGKLHQQAIEALR